MFWLASQLYSRDRESPGKLSVSLAIVFSVSAISCLIQHTPSNSCNNWCTGPKDKSVFHYTTLIHPKS